MTRRTLFAVAETKCRNHFRLVVDDGRLIEDVLHGGSSADSTLRLQRSNRNGRDVERNLRTDDPRLDDVPVGAAAGGKQTTDGTGGRIGERPARRDERVQHGAETADVAGGIGVGKRRRERQYGVTVDADANAVRVVDGQRTAGAVSSFGSRREGANGAGRTDRRRRRLGHLTQRTAGSPFGDDDAARASADDVEDASQTGRVDSSQAQSA